MSKIDLLSSIPLYGERIFSCSDMSLEKLMDFNEKEVKFIRELQLDGEVEIIDEPRRENTTGHSLISLIRVRRLS